MVIQIKRLESPYPYKEVAQHLKDIYFQEYGEEGTLVWDEIYTKFYFDTNVDKGISKEFAFGAFEGTKLIGTLFGHRDLVGIENQQLEMLNLGLLTVKPAYRRQGIAKKLLNQLITHAEERNFDLIIAFPQKGRYGDKILRDHFGFIKFGKTKHYLKLMEEQGLKAVSAQYGTLTTKISWLFSHIPDVEPPGNIRLGTSEDLEAALDLINSYLLRVPIATIYTLEGFRHTLKYFDLLKAKYPPPWGHQWFVMEREGELYSNVCCRVEKIIFLNKNGEFEEIYAALLTSLAFHEDMVLDEKKRFIGYILRKIRNEIPEVSCTQITTLQHEKKVIKKLRFLDDRNTYFLFMKPLSEKGEIINQYTKFKEFFLEYYR